MRYGAIPFFNYTQNREFSSARVGGDFLDAVAPGCGKLATLFKR
jgi:hypothetical protein